MLGIVCVEWLLMVSFPFLAGVTVDVFASLIPGARECAAFCKNSLVLVCLNMKIRKEWDGVGNEDSSGVE
jgi:hypothetical protein